MTSSCKSLRFFVVFYLSLLVRNSDAQLGAPCMSTVECGHWLLQCVSFQCACWPPYVPDVGNKLCTVDIDGRCERFDDICFDINASCNRSSIWQSSYCNCNDGFVQDSTTNRCQPRLGASCENDGLACVAGSCIDETCQCGPGLVASQNDIECGVDIGGACTVANPTCADPFAECNASTNICECREGYQSLVENGVTICKVALGFSCEVDTQCAVQKSSCEILRGGNSACTCTHGYVPSEDRTSCLPVTTYWRGACEEHRQCSAMFGRHSVCENNMCACISGYSYVLQDFGCVPMTATNTQRRVSESIKLLATTLLPYLPTEAQLAIDEIMDQL